MLHERFARLGTPKLDDSGAIIAHTAAILATISECLAHAQDIYTEQVRATIERR